MARPRKPTALKILHGEQNQRRIESDAPKPPEGRPDCPPHLTGLAAEEWGRMCDNLEVLGLLSRVYAVSLEGYCLAYQRWREAEVDVDKHEAVSIGASGVEHKSPYVSIANQAMAEVRKWLVEFGLTPAALTRVRGDATAGTKKKKETGISKYLA